MLRQSLGERVKEPELVVQELNHHAGRSRQKSRSLPRLTCHYLYKAKQLQAGKWQKHPTLLQHTELILHCSRLLISVAKWFLLSSPASLVRVLIPGCWLLWAGPIWNALVASWSRTAAGTFLKPWDLSLVGKPFFLPSSNKEQVFEK